MRNLAGLYREIDRHITGWMAKYGVLLLRISLGVVFFWFGVLKFFRDLSPAQDLAIRTIDVLTLGIVPSGAAIKALAAWECLIGLGMITGLFMRAVILLLFIQMLGACSPLFLFPDETFIQAPFAPTLEGQYIIKNLVIMSAAIVIGATVRGGRLVADPKSG